MFEVDLVGTGNVLRPGFKKTCFLKRLNPVLSFVFFVGFSTNNAGCCFYFSLVSGVRPA